MKELDIDNRDAAKPQSVVTTERRIDRKTRSLQIAAILCALFAAAGIAHGMHDANPAGGWLVPALAGIVAAAGFAIFWHVVIGSVVGMVRLATIIALFVGAVIVTAVAVGASAQAIATAISGRSALAAELSQQVDAYNTALAEAYTQATGWRGVAEAAVVLSAGFRVQANNEAGGGHGTGKGCGPKCNSYGEAAESFGAGGQALNRLLDDATAMRDKGDGAMTDLRLAAANGDQDAFMAAANAVAQQIGKLNAVDPQPIIANTGMVIASDKGIDLSAETADFEAKGKAALANRHAVDAPIFRPMSLGEATRKQFVGSALHGWILAGAIDILPLLFLAMIFVLSREVWLQEDVQREKLTAAGKNDRDRRHVDDLLNADRNVVPFKAAAE